MRVLFLLAGRGASTRYRVRQLVPLLEERGIRCELREVPSALLGRVRLFRSAGGFDCVMLQKRLLPPWQVRLLRRHARRLIYDVDDAVFVRCAPEPPHSRTRRRRFRATVRAADLTLAGNAFLAAQVEGLGGRAIVTPTTLSPAPYDATPIPERRHPATTLGWIGSGSTLHYLRGLAPALREAASRSHRRLRLKVICDVFCDFDSIETIPVRWSEETEVAELLSLDVGLSPLDDSLWSRGKCGFKTLQYFAARVPVICSPYGVHREIVRHGMDGVWAERPEDWVEAICMLAKNPAERRRLGDAGRARLEERYTPRAVIDRVVDALRGDLGR